jgi:hypothetical protein
MSLSTTARRVIYPGSVYAGATDFPIPFHFQSKPDIVATLVASDGTQSVLPLDSSYSLFGAGNANGGTLSLWQAIEWNQSLVIERLVPPVQLSDLSNQGAIYPEVIESALDRLAEIHQQAEDLLGAYDDAKTRVLKLVNNDSSGIGGRYDARGNRIINLADGSDPSDAITVGQVNAMVGGIIVGGGGTVDIIEVANVAPPAAVEYKNLIFVVNYSGGPSVAMICLERSDGSYEWASFASASA